MLDLVIQHSYASFTLDVAVRSAGPVLGVFGRSGSGKTTLLRAVAGLLSPRRARIQLGERLLAARPGSVWLPPEKRRTALVPQRALLFPHRSTRRNLTFAPVARGALESDTGRRVCEVLRLVPLLDRAPRTLSTGEAQRVALGRALLAAPDLLLLDEPTASLDAELGRDVLALLREVKRQLRTPMLFVTHKADELLALADDCVVLDEGRVVANGRPLEVLSRPAAIGVANLVGVDNLLRLDVRGHEPSGGVSLVGIGEQDLAVPWCDVPIGTALDLGIYADEVILSLERPAAISARNVLRGVVRAIDPVGHERLVRVGVGPAELLARLTPSAVTELGLAPGAAVYTVIKTSACHLLGR